MEDFTIRRRNRLRHHYTITSNVLLFGYKRLSDAAKITYQVIDSFDWSDSAGLRKGFAHPSLGRLAAIRGVDKRSIRRHLAQLEQAGLITRHERPGKPSLLVIEDPSAGETQRYLETFVERGADKNVPPTPDKNIRPYKEEEKEERQNIVNEIEPNRNGEEERPYEHIGHTVRETAAFLKTKVKPTSPEKAKREYLAQEMLNVLGDAHSLGCYRRIAERCPPQLIYEALGRLKELVQGGQVRKRGALFVEMMGRFAAARGIHLDFAAGDCVKNPCTSTDVRAGRAVSSHSSAGVLTAGTLRSRNRRNRGIDLERTLLAAD